MTDVFLLLGPEEGEKALFIKSTLAKIAKALGESPELYRYYTFEATVADVLAILRNGSLFSRHRAVILNNVEDIKRRDDVSLLEEYLVNPAENATLFLVSSAVKGVDRKIEQAVSPQNRKIFWEMFENKKLDWITRFFRERGMGIDQEAAAFLLEMIQNNTRDLREECNKLAQFFGDGSELRVEMIEKYIYHSKEENVFTLFERIASKDLAASQGVLGKILLSRESDPASLLSGLLWQIRKLQRMKALLENSYPLDEVFGKLRLRNRKAQRIYLNAHRNYTREEVQSLIVLINEFSIRIRSVTGELSTLLLQLFVYYAIVRGGAVPQIEETLFL
jgi:DNA polymerase-3 subunit delta